MFVPDGTFPLVLQYQVHPPTNLQADTLEALYGEEYADCKLLTVIFYVRVSIVSSVMPLLITD